MFAPTMVWLACEHPLLQTKADQQMTSLAKFLTTVGLILPLLAAPALSQELDDAQVAQFSRDVVTGSAAHATALRQLTQRADPDVAAALILAMRFRANPRPIAAALSKIVGQDIAGWQDAMLWQEANPDIVPHASYRGLKLRIYDSIDPGFMRFLGGGRSARENMKIRLEEITWGGVYVDGIPSLDNPAMISADRADYLQDNDLVFGVKINGDTRAYPLRIMGWHEMFNDTIGGVPVALAYCTLCGSGILFETHVAGRAEPLVFGSSGLLYRSNKLMFDRQTDSLWNQFTGEPVTGPLAGQDIALKILPVAITSWGRWLAANPDTQVLSLRTGYRRDYGSGVVYRDYFSSPDLMFPALVRDESVLQRKDYVFGIREFGAARAWPMSAFETRRVINDVMGDRALVLIGDAATRSVRAYARGPQVFEPGETPDQLRDGHTIWQITEEALHAPDGTRLPRVAGHVSYWFAWDGYMGFSSELYGN